MVDALGDVLRGNRYPGRGVLWCRTGDGKPAGGYFLTGRSAASKARALRLTPEGHLAVGPAGDTPGHDSLRHYVAARRVGGGRVVFGNGDQVDTVADRLEAGQGAADALGGLDYEPDPPIFTPRLTVVADTHPAGPAWFGAARHSASGRTATDRLTLRVSGLEPGEGVLMTTYRSDGTEIATGPPFTEVRVTAPNRAELLDIVWSSLAPELRVAAAAFAPEDLAGAAVRHA
jgi:IMP cyclohydrolase